MHIHFYLPKLFKLTKLFKSDFFLLLLVAIVWLVLKDTTGYSYLVFDLADEKNSKNELVSSKRAYFTHSFNNQSLSSSVTSIRKTINENLNFKDFDTIFPLSSSSYSYDEEKKFSSTEDIHRTRMDSLKKFCNSMQFEFHSDSNLPSIKLFPEIGWYECHIAKTGLLFNF